MADNEDLRPRVIEAPHAKLGGGHRGDHESYFRLPRECFWPRQTNDVAQYIRIAQRARGLKHTATAIAVSCAHYRYLHVTGHASPRIISCNHLMPTSSVDLHRCPSDGASIHQGKPIIPVANLHVNVLVQAFI
jgi:hypothetical protein